jgi:hypothetical protein
LPATRLRPLSGINAASRGGKMRRCTSSAVMRSERASSVYRIPPPGKGSTPGVSVCEREIGRSARHERRGPVPSPTHPVAGVEVARANFAGAGLDHVHLNAALELPLEGIVKLELEPEVARLQGTRHTGSEGGSERQREARPTPLNLVAGRVLDDEAGRLRMDGAGEEDARARAAAGVQTRCEAAGGRQQPAAAAHRQNSLLGFHAPGQAAWCVGPPCSAVSS